MSRLTAILSVCAIGLGAVGCSCSRDVPLSAPKWLARTADSKPEEPAIPEVDEPHAPATTPAVEPPEEAASEYEDVGQEGAPEQTPETDDAAANQGQSATPPPGVAVPGVQVIVPPSKPGSPPAHDAPRVAAEVERHVQAAQSLAQRGRFGEACRRLLAAYEVLEGRAAENGELHSELRKAVLQKLEYYGEQANRAAGADGAGRTTTKPFSVQ